MGGHGCRHVSWAVGSYLPYPPPSRTDGAASLCKTPPSRKNCVPAFGDIRRPPDRAGSNFDLWRSRFLQFIYGRLPLHMVQGILQRNRSSLAMKVFNAVLEDDSPQIVVRMAFTFDFHKTFKAQLYLTQINTQVKNMQNRTTTKNAGRK